MIRIRGVIAALPTPLDAKGNIVYEPLLRLVDAQIGAGIAGFWSAGGTANCTHLTLDERNEISRRVIDHVAGRVPVYVHAAAMTTADSCALAKAAADMGADVVSAIPPIFYPTDVAAIIAFLSDIQKAAGLPIVYYHVPGLTKVPLEGPDLIEIARGVPNIGGIKFSDMDFWKAIEVKLALPDLSIMTGCEEVLLGGLAMGCLDGGVGAAQNFIPGPLVELFDAYHEGDLARAQDLHWKCARVIQVQGMFPFGPTTYAILNLLGCEIGGARPPGQVLTRDQVSRVRKGLASCVSDAPFDEKRLIETRDLL